MKMEKKKISFKGQWTETNKTGLDYSRNLEPQFKEIPPYAKDEKGKFLNESSQPILVEGEPFDVDEYIQSFKDECDIYKILEKAYLSSNPSLLIQNHNAVYDDISELPDDPYEFEDMQRDINAALENLGSIEPKDEPKDENNDVKIEEKEVKQ